MPKLTKEDAKAVSEAEVMDFTPLDAGMYPMVLVEVTADTGTKGPYWQWTFEIPEGWEHEGRKAWLTTSLSEKARFKLKETFDAFGVDADTDTDELLGCAVVAELSVSTQQQGKNAGKLKNDVDRVLPYDESEFEEAGDEDGEPAEEDDAEGEPEDGDEGEYDEGEPDGEDEGEEPEPEPAKPRRGRPPGSTNKPKATPPPPPPPPARAARKAAPAPRTRTPSTARRTR